MRTLASLDSPIRSLVVSPDGSTVVAASDEGVGFFDLASGERRVTALTDGVRRLAWGPDGPLAGTAAGEVWTVGRRVERLVEAIDDDISGMAVAGDGTIAVCGGDPFAVATFGRYGNEEWRGEPSRAPYCVRFSADGDQLAMATWDGHLAVLDSRDLPEELGDRDAEYAGGPIFDVQFLPDQDVLVAGARFVRRWDQAAGAYTQSCELPAEALAIAVSPDGRFAVVSTNDQRLRLLRLPELDELGQLATGHDAAEPQGPFPDYAEVCRVRGASTIRTLVFHPDGTRLFASTEDGRLLEVSRAELDALEALAPARTAAPPAADALNGSPATLRRTSEALPRATRARAAALVPAPPAASTPPAHPPSTTKLSASPPAKKLSASPPAKKRSTGKPATRKPATRKPAARKLAAAKLAAAKLAARKLAAAKLPARKLAARPPAKRAAAKKASPSKAAGARRAIKKPAARAQPRR
jgi:hypothetical protein